MTRKQILFQHQSTSQFQSRWTVNMDTSKIRIEHNTRHGRWSLAHSVAVTDVHFVETGFDTNDRWRIMRYRKDGNCYQLTAEGPTVSEQRFYYEIKYESIDKGEATLLDTTHVRSMPTVETVV